MSGDDSALAPEEGRTEEFFKALHALADRRLRQAEFVCGGGETAALGGANKGVQVRELFGAHGRLLRRFMILRDTNRG